MAANDTAAIDEPTDKYGRRRAFSDMTLPRGWAQMDYADLPRHDRDPCSVITEMIAGFGRAGTDDTVEVYYIESEDKPYGVDYMRDGVSPDLVQGASTAASAVEVAQTAMFMANTLNAAVRRARDEGRAE